MSYSIQGISPMLTYTGAAIAADPFPALMIPSLKVNPFLNQDGNNEATDFDSDSDIEELLDNAEARKNRRKLPASPVVTAGEIEFFNTNIAMVHADATWRAQAYALLTRYHHVSDELITRYIAPTEHQIKGPFLQLLQIKVRPHQTRVQASILGKMIVGMEGLVRIFGRERLGVATPRQRRTLFETLYQQDAFGNAELITGVAKSAMPLRAIYSDTTAIHKKWKRFFFTKFLWTCELVWTKYVQPQTGDTTSLYTEWKNMMLRPEVGALELGGIQDIPVKAAGPTDTGARFEPSVPQGEEWELAPEEDE